ncbi:hypothetical protein ACVIW2_009408 [Bradyrhizobium huanghuaihaiense]
MILAMRCRSEGLDEQRPITEVHYRSEQEAEALKAELQTRLAECGLDMHPTKTRIIYCKDSRRKGSYSNVKFDFLGYCFRPRRAKNSQDASGVLQFSAWGQRFGAEVHAGGNPGFEPPKTNPCLNG